MSFVDGVWVERPLFEIVPFLEEGRAKELAAADFSWTQAPRNVRVMAAVAKVFLEKGLEIAFEKAWRIEGLLMAYRRGKVSLAERTKIALGVKKDSFPYSSQETAHAIMAKGGNLESKEVIAYLDFRAKE